MSSDTRALSPAIWGDISGEGTSNESVRVNFPGLGSRPSLSSSRVTVLGFSLQMLAVIMVAVLPGQPQRQPARKDVKTRLKGGMKSPAMGPFIISPPFFQLKYSYYCKELCFQTRAKWKMKSVVYPGPHRLILPTHHQKLS